MAKKGFVLGQMAAILDFKMADIQYITLMYSIGFLDI